MRYFEEIAVTWTDKHSLINIFIQYIKFCTIAGREHWKNEHHLMGIVHAESGNSGGPSKEESMDLVPQKFLRKSILLFLNHC